MKVKLLLGIASLALATPANAATYLITFEGMIVRGGDFSGIFGTPLADLTGQQYKTVYTLIDPLPGATYVSNPAFTFVRGGSSTGTPNPVSAKITINGVTASISGETDSSAEGGNSPDYLAYSARTNSFVDGRDSNSSTVHSIIFGADVFSAPTYNPIISYDIGTSDSARGYFEFLTYDYNVREYTVATNGNLSVSRVTIALAGANGVPEPATWLLMIAGFGAIGAGMRSSRRKASAPGRSLAARSAKSSLGW